MEPDELVLDLYNKVFEVAQFFLNQSKTFTINQLKGHRDPTYAEVARIAKGLAGSIRSVADIGGWENERIAINAQQAALHMERMALAIADKDEAKLNEAIELLENMSRI